MIRGSIVLRTTLVVLGATLAVGVLADHLAIKATRTRAVSQQREAMEALLDVVEPSAAAACFVEDKALAQQVVQGLVGSRSVQSAILRTANQDLAQASRDGPIAPQNTPALVRPLASPFAPESRIGELVLIPDPAEAARQVARIAAMVRAVVAVLSLALGCVMALVVHRSITRPIRILSRRLHELEATTGARLFFPSGHERDEIGQLVKDVNALVERLMNALQVERDLRGQLELDQRKVQAILENAGTGIFVVQGDGRMEAWTPAFLRLLDLEGASPPQGSDLPALFGLTADRVGTCLARCREQGLRQVETLQISDLQGTRQRWLQLTLDPIGPDWIQGLLEDVTSHLEAAEAAQELATRDALTGALNRLGAERLLGDRPSKGSRPLCLMLVDLDHFKQVNDSRGHDAGDEVLRQAVLRMQGSLRRTDEVARLGGDEFLLIVDNLEDEAMALGIADKLIAAIGMPVPLPEGDAVQVGASVGVALFPPGQAFTWEAALKRADRAMYQAKQVGRNCARLARD